MPALPDRIHLVPNPVHLVPNPIHLEIHRCWDGSSARANERVDVRLTFGPEALDVRIDAPWHGDARPPAPTGSLDGLWEHEVVEVMLLGEGERYLELEFGPHGHYLALALNGVRAVERKGMALRYEATRGGARWEGRASVARSLLPGPIRALNAFAIHGSGLERRYLAYSPAGGATPDFHRLDAFVPIDVLRREPWP